ncbi:MAG: DNA translocase FtsK 4TM domain-containing protein, partial [Bacteroidota bacterium]|nr:DNA translocase FtsK 4TM domain-containing protein [Bacteroidota bacterium]
MFKSKGIKEIKNKSLSSSQQLVLGSFLILLGIILGLSIVSYFFTGESDQSALNDFTNRSTPTENWLSKSGAWISHFLVFKGFGVASII